MMRQPVKICKLIPGGLRRCRACARAIAGEFANRAATRSRLKLDRIALEERSEQGIQRRAGGQVGRAVELLPAKASGNSVRYREKY